MSKGSRINLNFADFWSGQGIEPTSETWENTKPEAPIRLLIGNSFIGRLPALVSKKRSGESLSNISNNWIGVRPVTSSADET